MASRGIIAHTAALISVRELAFWKCWLSTFCRPMCAFWLFLEGMEDFWHGNVKTLVMSIERKLPKSKKFRVMSRTNSPDSMYTRDAEWLKQYSHKALNPVNHWIQLLLTYVPFFHMHMPYQIALCHGSMNVGCAKKVTYAKVSSSLLSSIKGYTDVFALLWQ